MSRLQGRKIEHEWECRILPSDLPILCRLTTTLWRLFQSQISISTKIIISYCSLSDKAYCIIVLFLWYPLLSTFFVKEVRAGRRLRQAREKQPVTPPPANCTYLAAENLTQTVLVKASLTFRSEFWVLVIDCQHAFWSCCLHRWAGKFGHLLKLINNM